MDRFKVSDEYFEKAMAIFPSSFPYYNRGCAYALIGENDKAFTALHKSADLGYRTKKDYQNAPELTSLKSDVRWKVLLEKLQ